MFTADVLLPGKFVSFFEGTGVVAGDPYSSDPTLEHGAKLLREAFKSGRVIKRAKGFSVKVTLTGERWEVRAALEVLWDYADTCDKVNRDEPEYYSEGDAGVVVRERVDRLLAVCQ